MNKIVAIILLMLSTVSCISVKQYNKHLETNIAPEKLKDDVDYTYKKLKQLHPQLYWFIDKEDLDKQFDSLKSTLNSPLKPSEFYAKLQPVIAKIKEGHLGLKIPSKRYTKKELKNLELQKGLFGRMNYVVNENRIFVKDNADKFENIKVGTEILKIKDQPVKEYLDKYSPLITSDGFNTTYQKYAMARRWPIYFTIENGILDSVSIETKLGSDVKKFYIHREKITKEEKKKEEQNQKKLTKTETGKTKDYNVQTRSYNRDLQFLDKDSTIAYMKIKTFSGTYSKKFYKQSFAKLKTLNAKYLIIDIRDNLGGSVAEINNLYSYLTNQEKFEFLKDIEITKRQSMLEADYFKNIPTVIKPLAFITYPLYFTGSLFSTKKRNDKIYLRNNGIFSLKKQKSNHFDGKIYILINGSSFSASSTIASKLKADQRATLVGEETGGANDGTVAGRYATKKLPNSKLKLPIGLMLIQPNIELTNTKKGVTPNVEIIPSLNEILQKRDPQLDWIMNDIKEN